MNLSSLIKIWILVRPIQRIKKALNKRRARLGKPLLKTGDIKMNEQVQTILRSVLKVVGTYFATKGYIDGTEVEAAVGAVVVLLGLVWSAYEHAKAK